MNRKQNFIAYIVASLLCTGMVLYLSTRVCDTYYAEYPYTFDQVNGLLDNSQAYREIKKHGRSAAAYFQYTQNHRSPFVPMVLSLAAPSLLKSHSGHLLITIPLFFLFLLLWAYLMDLRKFSAWLIVTILFAFSTTWIIYSQYAGIAFNLPDTIASYPLATCALLLLIWKENKKLIWLILFSVLLSIAVLIRYVFSVYAFLLFAPILSWLFYDTLKTKALSLRQVGTSIAAMTIVIVVLCGHFVVTNYNYTFGYYNYWLDNQNQTMGFNRWFSLRTFLQTFPSFFGRLHLLTFSFLVLFQFFSWVKLPLRERITGGAMSFWLLFALPFLWVVILGSNGLKVRSAFLAAMPLTWLAISSLSPLENSRKLVRFAITIFIALISLIHLWRSDSIINQILDDVDPKIIDMKTATLAVANDLSSLGKREYSIVDLTGLYLAESVGVEYFYKTGLTAEVWPNNTIFSKDGDLWSSPAYKSQTSADIGEIVLRQIKRDCNVVLIKKPDSVSLPSDYSRRIASFIKENLRKDNAWREFMTTLNEETLSVMIKE